MLLTVPDALFQFLIILIKEPLIVNCEGWLKYIDSTICRFLTGILQVCNQPRQSIYSCTHLQSTPTLPPSFLPQKHRTKHLIAELWNDCGLQIIPGDANDCHCYQVVLRSHEKSTSAFQGLPGLLLRWSRRLAGPWRQSLDTTTCWDGAFDKMCSCDIN